MQRPTEASTRWTDTQTEQVWEARLLFQRRALRLPPITIEFHDDDTGCNGHLGYFRPQLRRIDVCSDFPFVLIHELAHAWIEDNVPSDVRRAFVQRNSLQSWNDHDHQWNERGVEIAAFAIQQVVMRDLNRRSERNRELLANFSFLTRATPSTRMPV